MSGAESEWVGRLAELTPLVLYVLLLIIAFGENVVPPIPGDLAVVYAGYLAGVGRLDLVLVIVLSTLGGSVGFAAMFAVGRRLGPAVLDPNRLRWIPKRRISRASEWMGRWGYGVVAVNRFLSGMRSVIALTAGMAGMNGGAVIAYASLSALVWTALISVAGYEVGEHWEKVVEALNLYGNIVLGLLLTIALALAARAFYRRRSHAESVNNDSSA